MTPELYAKLKWGALFGGPLAILETLLYLLAIGEGNAANLDLSSVLMMTLEALLPLAAGFLATRQVDEPNSGWIAGLTSGVIVAVVNVLTEFIVPQPLNFLDSGDGQPLTSFDLAANWLLARIITIGFGIGFGWLGGWLFKQMGPSK